MIKINDLPFNGQSTSPEQTFSLAAQFGKLAKTGDVVLLQGPLGAGKTQFARGFCSGMGMDDLWEVDSPTYTVVNHYRVGEGVDHIDLYRFRDQVELDEIGFDEILAAPTVKLIEWPERLDNYPMPPAYTVRIRIVDSKRRAIEITEKTLNRAS